MARLAIGDYYGFNPGLCTVKCDLGQVIHTHCSVIRQNIIWCQHSLWGNRHTVRADTLARERLFVLDWNWNVFFFLILRLIPHMTNCIVQEPTDLYSHLIEREARHAPAVAGHPPKPPWNALPVGLPLNPQLDLTATSSHNSTRLLYSSSGRRWVHVFRGSINR